jgi:hypothetical protein
MSKADKSPGCYIDKLLEKVQQPSISPKDHTLLREGQKLVFVAIIDNNKVVNPRNHPRSFVVRHPAGGDDR